MIIIDYLHFVFCGYKAYISFYMRCLLDNFEQKHWETVYSTRSVSELDWYEESPEQSMQLIEKCNLDPFDIILDVGSGASTLIDHLLQSRHRQVIAMDISHQALKISQQRLGKNSEKVKWIVEDLLQPVQIKNISNVALWHDRAVLQFFTRPEQRNAYFKIMNAIVKVNGFVIIAAFSMGGETKCSGLDIVNYNEMMISKHLGNRYKLLDAIEHTCTTPNGGPRPYIYTRFLKIE